MNRILTFEGLQPLYLGDVDFAQDAVKEMLTCLARALMNGESDSLNAILQGVEIDQVGQTSYIGWTAGVVVLNGEILPIASGSVRGTLGTTPLYFHVEEVDSGSRTFKDGVSRNCWATRTATISTESTDGISVDSVARLHVPSDDAVYEGVPASANITSANLIKKNGMWYCDAHISLASGSYQTIGTVSFVIRNAAHGAQLSQKVFSFPLILSASDHQGETVVVTTAIHPVFVTFSEYENNQITMGIGFGTTDSTSAAGAGDIQALIPIFGIE